MLVTDESIKCPKTLAFQSIIVQPVADKAKLSQLSWRGIPSACRALTWKILIGYLPAEFNRREATLEKKRREYMDLATTCFSSVTSDDDEMTLRQIQKDLPRTAPEVALFQQPSVRISLERLLYTWAKQNPSNGYVQGMDDLVTPLFLVFLGDTLLDGDIDGLLSADGFNSGNPSLLETQAFKDVMQHVEADCYWCLAIILNRMEDHYTPDQPGLRRMVNKLDSVIMRNDPDLHQHICSMGVDIMHFAFRWMNCLLLREIDLKLVVRMWDTYLSESADAFNDFHVFVCAAFLDRFSDELKDKQEFGELFQFLQNLPTHLWTEKDIEPLLSQAFVLRSVAEDTKGQTRFSMAQLRAPRGQKEPQPLLQWKIDRAVNGMMFKGRVCRRGSI